MSDTNSPGTPGAEDPGGASWPEYLSSEAHGSAAAGSGADQPEQRQPRRVIGTPSPAVSRTLLAQPEGGGEPPEPFLPPEPADPVRARKAELIVAACFVLAMISGFAFLVAYGLIGLGSVTKVWHSNLALASRSHWRSCFSASAR